MNEISEGARRNKHEQSDAASCEHHRHVVKDNGVNTAHPLRGYVDSPYENLLGRTFGDLLYYSLA